MKSIIPPFTILIDTREQLPYSFAACSPRARGGAACAGILRHALAFPGSRYSYDYSLLGCTGRFGIERKSLADLYGTLSQGRDDFEAKLPLMNAFEWFAVIVEASWQTIVTHPPSHSKLRPQSVWGSIIAWQHRYPKVHWIMYDCRELAEIGCYRHLERCWIECSRQDAKPSSGAAAGSERNAQHESDDPSCSKCITTRLNTP